MLIHHHVCTLRPTIRDRQLASSTFGASCRAIRHTQLLPPPSDELVASEAAEVRAAAKAIRTGRLQERLVRALEIEVNEDELEAAVELLALAKGGLIGFELGVVPRGGATGGRRWHLIREMTRPTTSFVRAMSQLTKLERVIPRGTKDTSALSVLELEVCIHHWPLLAHSKYDRLGLHVPPTNQPPPMLAHLSVPAGLRTLAIQSIHNDAATELFTRLVAASRDTLARVILANAHIGPTDELAPILQPVAGSLATLEYHPIQCTPLALAGIIVKLTALKEIIVPVDRRTRVFLEAMTAKACDSTPARLECLTILPEEYPAINYKAPKVMPARRRRLLELARVVDADRVRIGNVTMRGAEGVSAQLNSRGIKLEVVDSDEDEEGDPRKKRWVWH